MNTVFKTVNLAKDYLETKLKMMGIKDETCIEGKIDSSAGYHVLRRIGSSLENFRSPISIAKSRRKNKNELLDEIKQEIEDDNIFMENQDDFIERIRAVHPEFATSPHKKVSLDDWEHYIKTVRTTASLIRDLTIGSETRDLTQLSQVEAQDIISELIDSQDFARACDIEDNFMMQEYADFRKAAEELGYEDESIKETSVCVSLAELVRETESLSCESQRRRTNFEKYRNFLKSLKGKVTLKHRTHGEEGVDRDE